MQHTCNICSKSFEATESDLQFLDQVSPIFSGKKY